MILVAERRSGFLRAIGLPISLAGAVALSVPAVAQETPEAAPVEPVEVQELAPPPPREFDGTAIAIDSVTIVVAGEALTLYGLSPMRTDWRAAAAARSALDDLVRGVEVHCTEAGRDRNRRLLATCSAAELDISEAMLGAGMSLVDRGVTWAPGADVEIAERYDAAERAARDGSAGLWATVPGYEPKAPMPPIPGLWDRVEHYQAGFAVLAGMVIVASAIVIAGRRRR